LGFKLLNFSLVLFQGSSDVFEFSGGESTQRSKCFLDVLSSNSKYLLSLSSLLVGILVNSTSFFILCFLFNDLLGQFGDGIFGFLDVVFVDGKVRFVLFIFWL
jgi:hypothetical protein